MIITGAARGIGRACALRAASEGANLVISDIASDLPDVPYQLGTFAQLEQTAELCRSKGVSVVAVEADVRLINSVLRKANRFSSGGLTIMSRIS